MFTELCNHHPHPEKALAPHCSTLAWKIPWTEEPGRLQSMGSLRVGHNWATSLSLFTFMHWRRKWQPTPVLAWRIPGMGEPGGLPSVGLHRVGQDWSDLAAGAAASPSNSRTFFMTPKRNPVPNGSHSPFHPLPRPWQSLIYFVSVWTCLFRQCFTFYGVI